MTASFSPHCWRRCEWNKIRHAHIHTHTYTRTHTLTHTRKHTTQHTHTHTHANTHLHTHTTHTHAHAHAHRHTHTHTRTQRTHTHAHMHTDTHKCRVFFPRLSIHSEHPCRPFSPQHQHCFKSSDLVDCLFPVIFVPRWLYSNEISCVEVAAFRGLARLQLL